MNLRTELIPHSELTEEQLLQIIKLKSVRWPYSEAQQRAWMQENISPEDFHILVYDEDFPIAYTNFVKTNVEINGKDVPFMGIGNVCTAESGKGYGNILMDAVNKAIAEKKWNGILLCQDRLVPYYEKFGWKLVSAEKIQAEKLKSLNTMLYNFEEEVLSLSYTGRNF